LPSRDSSSKKWKRFSAGAELSKRETGEKIPLMVRHDTIQLFIRSP
jgi:hypothetical protein